MRVWRRGILRRCIIYTHQEVLTFSGQSTHICAVGYLNATNGIGLRGTGWAATCILRLKVNIWIIAGDEVDNTCDTRARKRNALIILVEGHQGRISRGREVDGRSIRLLKWTLKKLYLRVCAAAIGRGENQRAANLNIVMNHHALYKTGNFFTIWKTISFWSK
jgi:hypothetical protein